MAAGKHRVGFILKACVLEPSPPERCSVGWVFGRSQRLKSWFNVWNQPRPEQPCSAPCGHGRKAVASQGCAAALWGVSPAVDGASSLPAGRGCPAMRLQPPPSLLLWGELGQAFCVPGPLSLHLRGAPPFGTQDPADTTTRMGQRGHFAKHIFQQDLAA